MDEESIFQQFDRLEARFDDLVKACEEIRAKNALLEARVAAQEEELRQKAANENRLIEERTLVRSRIDSLLSRVNETVDAGFEE